MSTHLIHAPLDMRAFNRWAGERGLVHRGVYDVDYALHIMLSAMFGKGTLQPFRLFWSERRRRGALYAYTDSDRDALAEIAVTAAPPDCLHVVNPGKLLSKPMPTRFAQGRRLGFDLRVRPIRRIRTNLRDTQQETAYLRGREVDAYRLEIVHRFPEGWTKAGQLAAQQGINRESVYTAWLAERFGDAAGIEECRLAAFSRTRAGRGSGRGP